MSSFVRPIVVLLLAAIPAWAQVKIDGPKEATVGYRTKAKVTIDGNDPKVECFPANEDWILIQDWSGNKFIDFVPGRTSFPEQTSVTFIIAANKADKTYIEKWTVVVKPDGSTPIPPPKPGPDEVRNTELYKSLLGSYQVSPDSEAKTALIQVYEAFLADINADKFTSFKEAAISLANVTPRYVGEKLKPVRSTVADYLRVNAGQSASTMNKEKLSKSMTTVVAAMKALPN